MRKMVRLAWAGPLVAVVVLSAVAGVLAASTPAQAGGNTMSISPAEASVSPGGSRTVDLVANPPASTLATWVVRVEFDPAVVSFSDCDPIESQAGSVTIGDCQLAPGGGEVVVVGGVVFFESGDGLSAETVLASMTFEGEGEVGECSDLTVTVQAAVDSDAAPVVPAVSNGEICITEGEPQIWGDVDCNGSFSIGDAQKIARDLIDLAITQTQPCPGIGDPISVDGNDQTWGDFDCNGSVSIGDAQKVARALINLNVTQTQPCPDYEEEVIVN